MPANQQWVLYHYPSCPYCQIVRRVASELGVELELRDIHADPAFLRELVAATGRRTVPCLRIPGEGPEGDDRWMHESMDIIEWLEKRLGADRGA